MGLFRSLFTGLGLVAGGFVLGGIAKAKYDFRNPIEHSQINSQSIFKTGTWTEFQDPFEYTQIHIQSPIQEHYHPKAEGYDLRYIKKNDGKLVPAIVSKCSPFVGAKAYELKRENNQCQITDLTAIDFTRKLATVSKPKKAAPLEEKLDWEQLFE